MASSDRFSADASNAEILSASTSDPAEFELALRPWELLCHPQRAGDFRHDITAIKSQMFILYREHYNLPIKLQGLSPEGMLGICIPLDYNSEPSYWSEGYSKATMVATLPGPADAVLSSRYSHIIALIAVDHLRQAMLPDDWVTLETAARSHIFQLSPRQVDAFSHWGNNLLDVVSSWPKIVENPAFVEDVLREITDFLVRVSEQLPPSRPVSNRATRQAGLLKALDYLRDRLDGRISIADLCRVTGVSERTLQYAFHDAFGITPTEFMRRRRLHAVRRKLVTSSVKDSSVSQIALEYGFYELGRFAVEYRRLFGIHPSDSLRSRSHGRYT